MHSGRMKTFCLTIGMLILSLPFSVCAQKTVIASTSLAGAIARAAGARDVRVLTPGELKHPPEYELKPSDLMKFEGAAVAVYGGYEKMVARLVETAKSKTIISIQIDTTTTPENLIDQARKISNVLNTQKEEQVWELKFIERLKALQKKLTPVSGRKAVIHLHAQPYARWAGLAVLKMVMPGELTPRAIAEAISGHPELVMDILHLPVAKVIADNAKCPYIQVINFPGIDRTETLEDIFDYNAAQLMKVLQ